MYILRRRIKMLKILKKLCIPCLVFLGLFSELNASHRLYFNIEEMGTERGIYYIPSGQGIWVESYQVHQDETGYYVLESDLVSPEDAELLNPELAKTWKCPYCYHYWPIGVWLCPNKDCPSSQ